MSRLLSPMYPRINFCLSLMIFDFQEVSPVLGHSFMFVNSTKFVVLKLLPFYVNKLGASVEDLQIILPYFFLFLFSIHEPYVAFFFFSFFQF